MTDYERAVRDYGMAKAIKPRNRAERKRRSHLRRSVAAYCKRAALRKPAMSVARRLIQQVADAMKMRVTHGRD